MSLWRRSQRSREEPGPIWWALRALRKEVWGFRFDYPLEVISDAGGSDSLHYYIYSERLFFDVMEVNGDGIPMHRLRRFGATYNPAYVAWYALANLERGLRRVDPAGEKIFLRQVDSLVSRAMRTADGAVAWPCMFDWHEGRSFLKAPWISALTQGLVMSALVRAHRLTGRAAFLELALDAVKVFEKNVRDGGVRSFENGRVLFEEYPAYPLPRILDGFLFSLLGLHDVAVATRDVGVAQLFSDGVKGLSETLPFWDYRQKWSWYGSHGYLCPPHYNKLNVVLLTSLARITADPRLAQYARDWAPERLSIVDRLELFSLFIFTKNRSRLRSMICTVKPQRQRTHDRPGEALSISKVDS
jgi:heparosan-N-sulfate-glucuronate 5-epimerase